MKPTTKRTRKREFLDEMQRVVPWAEPIALIGPAMEEALHDVPLYREFADLESPARRLPDESTILRFRHLLEEHGLAAPMPARGWCTR